MYCGMAAAAEPRAKEPSSGSSHNPEAPKRQTSTAVEAAITAHAARRLAAYADRHKDALVMIAAAQVLKNLGVREIASDSKNAPTGDLATKQGQDMTLAGILERAKKHASGIPVLIALAEDVALRSVRGDIGLGGCYANAVVRANGRLYHQITFREGEFVIIELMGDGDTDLDMIVRDQNGHTICAADGPTDMEICRWKSASSGPVRIEVINLGSVHNVHRLCTNQ